MLSNRPISVVRSVNHSIIQSNNDENAVARVKGSDSVSVTKTPASKMSKTRRAFGDISNHRQNKQLLENKGGISLKTFPKTPLPAKLITSTKKAAIVKTPFQPSSTTKTLQQKAAVSSSTVKRRVEFLPSANKMQSLGGKSRVEVTTATQLDNEFLVKD